MRELGIETSDEGPKMKSKKTDSREKAPVMFNFNDFIGEKSVVISKSVEEKRIAFEQAKTNLKCKFVQLDSIIDKIFANIEAWWFMPELLQRPIIINLWGMTGVGKTDLVRSIVKELGMGEKFVEVQMSRNGMGMNKGESLKDWLEGSNISEDEPGILLLDEMQNYRTISPEGDEFDVCAWGDVWGLLSDGKFSTDGTSTAISLASHVLSQLRCEVVTDKDGFLKVKMKKRDPDDGGREGLHYWDAKELKTKMRIGGSVLEIMSWNGETVATKVIARLKEMRDNSEGIVSASHKRLLVFTCGNLDEMYNMAKSSEDADLDADFVYDETLALNVIDVKRALATRFKPEQIARLGNVHIVYPSLKSSSYTGLIVKKVNSILDSMKNLASDIDITVDDSIISSLYDNGVFPVQGVRPLFSTIASDFEAFIPDVAYTAKIMKLSSVRLAISDGDMVASFFDSTGKAAHEKKYHPEMTLDKLRKRSSENKRDLISVHEAGHAVVNSVLLGMTPVQVTVFSVTDVDGRVSTINKCQDYESITKTIAIAMAGRAAEEIVYSYDKLTCGSEHDLKRSTAIAASMIREGAVGTHMLTYDIKELHFGLCPEVTDDEVEKLVKAAYQKALSVLNDNREFFRDMVNELRKKKKLNGVDIADIAEKYGLFPKIVTSQNDVDEYAFAAGIFDKWSRSF